MPVMNADSYRDLLPLFPEHSSVSPDGELAIGGVGVRDLAERFGTPAYMVDEAGLRNQAGRFKDGLATLIGYRGGRVAIKTWHLRTPRTGLSRVWSRVSGRVAAR